MSEVLLATLGGTALVLGLASARLRDLPVTEPMVALLVGMALGPVLADEIRSAGEHTVLLVAAQVSVALAVMSAVLRFDLAEIARHLARLVVLLAVVLPLMAVTGHLLALAVLGLPAAGAWMMAAALAPTDPVLASNVVTGRPAERDLPRRVRVVLSIESAANDGLAFVFVLVGLAALSDEPLGGAVLEGAGRSVLGAGVGLALGWAAGRALVVSEQHRDVEHSAFLALTLILTLFVLGTAELVGGQGIVAVFAAGVGYSHSISRSERSEEWEVQEAVNRFLVLPVFTMLGAVIPWGDWRDLGWRGGLFVVGILALRRLPAVVVLSRPLRLQPQEAGFVGWFGPIGVAALFYLAYAFEEGAVDDAMWAAGTLVIAASTIVHGVTATPLRRLMAPRPGRPGGQT